MNRYTSTFAALMLTAAPVMAQVPTVTSDIGPVHSLVAQVMGDLGEPTLLLEKGASPHDYAMRPSDAKNLQNADVVFWIGDALSPWLEGAISNLAPDAVSVPLLEAEATLTVEFREGLTFEDHDHADHDDDHADHDDDHAEHGDDDHDAHEERADHDDHEGEDHKEHDDHDDHKNDDSHDNHEEHGDHDGHDHSGVDPHAWLDPKNAVIWLDVIAHTLADVDPENAETYAQNAAAAAAELSALTAQLQQQLADESDLKFVVFHDAYHYFETRFGLAAMGAISLGDAAAPSPARISELRESIKDKGVDCVFSEPQFNAGLVATLLDGTSAHSGVIDPLGVGIVSGPDFYAKLIQGVADSFDACR